MRRYILLSLLLFVSITLNGQKVFDCEPVKVQKLDSVVQYIRETGTDIYTPVELFIYQYNEAGQYPVIDRISLPSRTPVNRQNYFFDETGRKEYYVLQEWNTTEFTDHNRTDYYYDESGQLSREVYSGLEINQWIPYQQHWYNYAENGIVSTYLRQMMYSDGVWTNFSYKNYIYDARGRLIERNEQRIADGVIFWVELFTYDDKGRTATRIRQSLKYYSDTRTYAMVNLNKQIYSYDIYGDLSEYAVETWVNDSWLHTGKSIYYRTLLYGTRVPVCYKGNTVALPVKMVARVLEWGGVLGPCKCQTTILPDEDLKAADTKPTKEETSLKVILYPNPGSSRITVWSPALMECSYYELNIYNGSGALVIKESVTDQSHTIDISHLKPGSYHLSLKGEGGAYMTTFVKK